MNVLHPPFVHFVIALPVAALFSQLTYLATHEKIYAKAATRILAFSLLVSLFAVFSGFADAEKILSDQSILQNGLNVLNAHKIFGIIIVGILFVTTLITWFSASKESQPLKRLSLIFIILTIVATLYQGNNGGSLVYQYSGGISDAIISQRADAIKSEDKSTEALKK